MIAEKIADDEWGSFVGGLIWRRRSRFMALARIVRQVIWTAAELGLDYNIATEELIADPELRSLHPQGKIPSAKVGDVMLFESVAICEYLCDLHPNNRLLGESESVARAIHTQWASFAQSEIEAI